MGERAIFTTVHGGTVTAFALGPLEEQYFPGEITRGTDNVDYKFVNGFVDVGELPCRTALRADIASRSVALEPFVVQELNLPGFNRRLEFSGFWHVPTRLKRWAKTTLVPSKTGLHRIRLATCGGVHIWVDGDFCASFEPFSRNSVQETELDIPLKAEGSEVVLLVEEMAERDTNYFAELTWLGRGVLQSELESCADADALLTLMDVAQSIHPTKISYSESDDLELRCAADVPQQIEVSAVVKPSVHMRHMPPLFEGHGVLEEGKSCVNLGGLADLVDGYHALALTFSIGESRVTRQIDFARLSEINPSELPASLKDRKSMALRHAAAHGEARIGKVLAQLGSGLPIDAAGTAIIEDTIHSIEARKDCSDFVMLPLLWLYVDYCDQMPKEVADRVRSAILGYRYWMDEPGNDTMWFWSENHVLCFLASGSIAGTMFPNEVFTNSGLTGGALAKLADVRLDKWFASVEAHGLAEWNSAAYYPIDFIGLFALQHLCAGALKSRATEMLDRLFEMIALHTMNGVCAGTMGRAYDKELRAGPLTELSPFAAVAFGTGWLNQGVASLPMFCLSDYEPPSDLTELANVPPREVITAQYIQGYGAAARLSLTKSASIQLSASIDGAPGDTGHQQHLVDVQAAGHPFARVWVNHPGEDDPWGGNRPSYWAGNGVMPRVGMSGECCLVLSELGDGARLPFTHVYAPTAAFDEVLSGVDWRAFRSGNGFVLLKATGVIESVKEGPGADIEHRCNGARTGWAIIVGELEEKSFADIGALGELMRLVIDGSALKLHRIGKTDLILDYLSGLSRGTQSIPFPTESYVPKIAVRSTPATTTQGH